MEPQKRGNGQKALKRRLQERLKCVGMTYDDLVEATGDDWNQVQRWIGGPTKVPADFLVRYARAVPVSLEWLLFEHGQPEPQPEEREARGFKVIAGVVRAISEASDADEREFELALRQRLVEEIAAMERREERTKKSS